MHSFKLTPTPRSDYRLEIKEIQKKCKIEKHGYRHNKIIYGFCHVLPDLSALQARGVYIEEIAFKQVRLELTEYLVERSRAKSKVAYLKDDREEHGTVNESEEALVQQNLTYLNDKIQTAKEVLGITGTVKLLKF